MAGGVELGLGLEFVIATHHRGVSQVSGAGEGDTPEAAMLRRIVDVIAVYEHDVIRGRKRAAMTGASGAAGAEADG